MRSSIKYKILFLFILILLIISACNPSASVDQNETPTITNENVDLETPTPTPAPDKNVVICVGQEPETLYPYAGSSESMWSVLEAIYDGPFDSRNFSTQPVILSDLPSYENGGVILQAATVQKGDEIVDANGDIVALDSGTLVMPAGCTSPLCAVSWDGVGDLQINQVFIQYSILPGIEWSDGTPVNASDSVYSFELASHEDTPVSKWHVDRTYTYAALDESTVQWVGIPGFIPEDFGTNFYLPFPEHLSERFHSPGLINCGCF